VRSAKNVQSSAESNRLGDSQRDHINKGNIWAVSERKNIDKESKEVFDFRLPSEQSAQGFPCFIGRISEKKALKL
jgi:hypothetical protein